MSKNKILYYKLNLLKLKTGTYLFFAENDVNVLLVMTTLYATL